MVLLLAVLPLMLLLLAVVVFIAGGFAAMAQAIFSETSRDAVVMYFLFLLRVVELPQSCNMSFVYFFQDTSGCPRYVFVLAICISTVVEAVDCCLLYAAAREQHNSSRSSSGNSSRFRQEEEANRSTSYSKHVPDFALVLAFAPHFHPSLAATTK